MALSKARKRLHGEKCIPSPSRGRLGWGWVECVVHPLPHPHPSPPLEGEGVCAVNGLTECHEGQGQVQIIFSAPADSRILLCYLRAARGFTLADLAISSSPSSAWLTAAPLGNALATSGASTTTFDAALTCFAYFPRVILPKSPRRYSGLNSSAVFSSFFIKFSFSLCRGSGADNACMSIALYMRDCQQPSGR